MNHQLLTSSRSLGNVVFQAFHPKCWRSFPFFGAERLTTFSELHPGKLTHDNGKNNHLKMYLLLITVIFHWYVSFPGGTCLKPPWNSTHFWGLQVYGKRLHNVSAMSPVVWRKTFSMIHTKRWFAAWDGWFAEAFKVTGQRLFQRPFPFRSQTNFPLGTDYHDWSSNL